MSQSSISGMPIAMLSGLGMPASDQAELLSIANGSDFARLDGLGAVSDEQAANEFEDGFYNVLVKTRKQVINNPEIFAKVQNPMQLKEMLDQAIKYYYTDKRDQVFDKLAEIEETLEREGLINLEGIYIEDGIEPEYQDLEDWLPVEGVPIGAVENEDHYFDGENVYIERDGQVYMAGLGEVYGFFKKAKKALKKTKKKVKRTGKKVKKGIKKGIKKTVHALMHINPATIAIRMAFRAGIKMNVGHVANKLAYGYMTWAEAEREGFSRSEWKRLVRAKDNTLKAYKALGGKRKALKKAIVKGNRSNRKIDRVKPEALYPEMARANARLEAMEQAMKNRFASKAIKVDRKTGRRMFNPRKLIKPRFASAKAIRGLGESEDIEAPEASEATENANPEAMAETKAAGGLFKKIAEWFKGLFDKDARAARKAERQANRLEPELDAEGNPVLDENGQPKMKEKQGLFNRMNDKKDTRGSMLFDKAFNAGTDVLVHKIKEKGGVPSNELTPVYNSQPQTTTTQGNSGGNKKKILIAAGVVVAAGVIGYGIYKATKKDDKKTKKTEEKKPLSGVRLK